MIAAENLNWIATLMTVLKEKTTPALLWSVTIAVSYLFREYHAVLQAQISQSRQM